MLASHKWITQPSCTWNALYWNESNQVCGAHPWETSAFIWFRAAVARKHCGTHCLHTFCHLAHSETPSSNLAISPHTNGIPQTTHSFNCSSRLRTFVMSKVRVCWKPVRHTSTNLRFMEGEWRSILYREDSLLCRDSHFRQIMKSAGVVATSDDTKPRWRKRLQELSKRTRRFL